MTELYTFNLQEPREHTAFEKSIIERGINTFAFCTLESAVFIGTDVSSNTFVWNNPHNVKLVRYNGTGGPVYFNKGNIKTVFLTDYRPDAEIVCKDWIVKSLRDIGVAAENGAGNDIYLNGKKICGVGTKQMGNKIYLPFFFSLDIDFDIAGQVMKLQKHTSNLRERAIGINQTTGKTIKPKDILNSLVVNFPNYFQDQLLETSLSPELLEKTNKNLEQFNDLDWLKYGKKYR